MTEFNSKSDPRCLRQDQVMYCINLLRYCSRDFDSQKKLRNLFDKVMTSLELLYKELSISFLFDRIARQINFADDVTQELVLKMLLRCKLLMEVRAQLIEIFNLIDHREKVLRELNYLFVKGDFGGRFNMNEERFFLMTQSDKTTAKEYAMLKEENRRLD